MKSKYIIIFSSLMTYQYAGAQSDLVFKNSFEIVPRLNDTGIVWSGESSSANNVDCNSSTINAPQDCDQGRDFTHNDPTDGHAGFNFTKLDFNGVPLVNQNDDYATTPWSCVQDNVTGLVWEVKNNIINDIHNIDNTYRWGGITRQGNFGTDFFNDWDNLVNGSNNELLCGFNDWRVPITQELMSIIDYNFINPAVDIDYFPNATGSIFWSSSPYTRNPSSAWLVLFFDGNSSTISRSNDYPVRLVRSAQ